MRAINDKFIKDLNTGELSYFLTQVKNQRDKLCLEIRDGYINIYYKGGSLLKITQKRNGYSFFFDSKYCLHKENERNYSQLHSLDQNSAQDYIRNFNIMMEEMDSWLLEHPKAER